MSRRTLAIVISTVLAVVAGATPAAAHSSSPSSKWPSTLALPAGFQPEGVAIGDKPYAYFGSRVDGDIYRVSLRTGKGSVFSEGPGAGNPSLGLKIGDRNRLFVAGGSAGSARVVDLRSGQVLKSYTLKTPGSTAWFINDVVLTRDAAWFTDSANPVLWKVPLNLKSAPVAVPLTGDIQYTTGNNANGISRTPDGRALIVVQSNVGKLFKVGYDGRSTEIKLNGTETVVNGDGLWLRGHHLYVVQNRLNVIAKVSLDKRATKGQVVSRTGSASFDVPTTIAEYGKRFYLPNARFTTPAEPTTTYDAVAVPVP
ncbi:SMP-30/gluconolactonase/LRE family protein [Paractinoplanes lichenicola]|uniref:Superoxide dismutase n=1 Tax=Paractinoplanes lichenicola TaxID=2802976 RepID=A0ABS1VNI7_9ACTN|nr:superoxide dismutase [Actinoplanes lichenicola]MBL7256297.1 superoxide dismutase [Actinoplanes lichenicola]